MKAREVHVVGAGLAGLSAALRLQRRRVRVHLWEATGHAGGRCRSFDEPRLGRRIDNGNHLVLSGNTGVRDYLRMSGATAALRPEARARFPFVDLSTGARWSVHMNRGPIPWWVADAGRRVPETAFRDYLQGFRLALAGPETTVAECIRDRGPLWRRFWEPMTLAVLNTTPERGAARLLWRVLRETFARGEDACRPMLAPDGLGEALVTPALARLRAQGAEVTFNAALTAIETAGDRVAALVFGDRRVPIGPDAAVILALPPSRLKALLPVTVPDDRSAILNAHFVVPDPALLAGVPPILGLVGARTHWIFTRGDVVSLTISAAGELGAIEGDREALADTLWAETRAALNLPNVAPAAARILTERRATFDQSPEGVAKRPKPRTILANLFLAGDATDTGLPATIEGAIRSGETAAALAA